MQAMNGSAVSFRSTGRLIGCCMALVLLVSALFASVTSTASASPKAPTAYVAIGDSISFGYKEATFNANYAPCTEAPGYTTNPGCEPPENFEPGFVGIFGKALAGRERRKGNTLTTVNLGCPGERSDGMIGHNPLIGGLGESEEKTTEYTEKHAEPPADQSHSYTQHGSEYDPCAYHNKDGLRLKTEYDTLTGEPGSSQLEAAIGAVETKTVTAVTINMGSNDELETVAECATPAYDAEQGFKSLDACLEAEAAPETSHQYPGVGLFGHIIANIGDVIGVLRSVHYDGKIVVLGFYNPQAEFLIGSDLLQLALNHAFEGEIAKWNAEPDAAPYCLGECAYANPFPIFNYTPGNKHSEKTEKAHIERYTEEYNPADIAFNDNKEKEEGKPETHEGDIHPTEEGYKAMAKLVGKAYGF